MQLKINWTEIQYDGTDITLTRQGDTVEDLWRQFNVMDVKHGGKELFAEKIIIWAEEQNYQEWTKY